MRGNERKDRGGKRGPKRRDEEKQKEEYVIVFDSREEDVKESEDLTGGLSRLLLFVIQY